MAEIVLNVVKKEKNFTIIDNGIFKDNTLSAKAKGVLTTMLSLPPSWKYSIEGIATLFSDGETAIRSALQELENSGYLKRDKLRDDKNRITGWKYTVYEIKQSISSEDTENSPHVENPHVDFPLVENKAQLSTNKLSTKKENNTIPNGIVEDSSTPEDTLVTEELSDYEKHMFSDDVKKKRKIVQAEDKPKQKRLSLWDKCVQAIEEYTDDPELRNALTEYLKLRLEIKDKPIYANQWKGLLNKLQTLTGDPVQIVKRSTELGYASFYELQEWKNKGRKPDPRIFGEHAGMNSNKVSNEEREELLKNGVKF